MSRNGVKTDIYNFKVKVYVQIKPHTSMSAHDFSKSYRFCLIFPGTEI